MQKINSSHFQKSVFNIGAGKDLNPLIRFAHYSDTFIFTNIYIDFDKINSWYLSQFQTHPDFELVQTEVISRDAHLEGFELNSGRYEIFVNAIYPFNEPDFMEEYTQAFRKAIRETCWLVYFEVKFRPLDKTLNLYYYRGEGLATYVNLSQSGKLAPRVLLTIQTGFLEFPEQILDKYFSRYQQPFIWVRGFEPEVFNFGRQLEQAGIFRREGLRFNHHWTLGKYSKGASTVRYCKAFISEETFIKLNANPKTVLWHGRHKLLRYPLGTEELINEKDAVIISKRLERLKEKIPEGAELVFWESLVGSIQRGGGDMACNSGAKKQFDALRKFFEMKNKPFRRIHLTPFCLESEMDIYKAELLNFPFETYTYGPYPLDFVSYEELEGTKNSPSFP